MKTKKELEKEVLELKNKLNIIISSIYVISAILLCFSCYLLGLAN